MKNSFPRQTSFSPTVITLPSGLRVVIDEVPSVASCALGVWVDAGTRDEPRNKVGVAHLVEHTSFRRTRHLTTQGIARAFENVGAYANAYTTKEETSYEVRTLTEHLPAVVKALAEVVVYPRFDAADVAKEQLIVTEEIRSYEDDPEERVFDSGEQMLFGKHPLGNPILGSIDSVANLTAEDVRAFHDTWYRAGHMCVCISGNVSADAFAALIDTSFAVPHGVSRRRRSRPNVTTVRKHAEQRAVQQTHILLQVPVGGSASADKHGLTLLNVILGDGMTSRLNRRLREARGMAYSIYSQLQMFRDVGVFAIYAGTDPQRIDRARRMVLEECENLAKGTVTAVELRRAKQQIRASKIMSLESLSSRVGIIAKGMLEDGRPEDPFAVLDEMEAVTLADINELARRTCAPDGWSEYLLLPEGA